MLLQISGMARSKYYYHNRRIGMPDGYDGLRGRIHEIYDEHHGRYGYRRITAQLHNEGMDVNHKTVQKLMSQMGLKGAGKKRKYHSYKGRVGDVAPNILDRDFKTDAPFRKWTTDVTQVCIHDRTTYLSALLDMYNGEIMAYVISRSPNLHMVTEMTRRGIEKLPEGSGLILHSDQGWHYQHPQYQKLLKDNGITQSMSRKGNCLDNAMMENFFGLMKRELLYLRKWDSIEQFEYALRAYIKYYNNDRIKIRLDGMSPVQYRDMYNKSLNKPSNF